MSHQCKSKRSRTRILSYFQTVQGGPNCPLPTAMNSQVTKDTLKTAGAHKTVIKIKRRKTRRELNRAKFGKAVVEKLFKCKAGRPFQDMPPAEKCHCQCVVSSWAAGTSIPKPSPNPSWIITQRRLTHHLGIFNKEVKSINIERLLDREQTKDCCPAITKESTTAKFAEEAMEVASCTPVPKEAVVPVQQPHSLTPKLQPVVEDAHTTLTSPTQATESKSQCHQGLKEWVVPTTELANKLIKTLNTHQVFPGQDLVHSTQQELVNILIERHGKKTGPWVPVLSTQQESGMSRPPRFGCSPLDESTIVTKSLSPKDRRIEDSFLNQNDGSVCGPLSSTHSTVVSHLRSPKLDNSGFTGGKIFGISLSGAPGQSGFSPRKVICTTPSLPGPQVGSFAGNQADKERAFNTSAHQQLWLWRNAGNLQRTKAAQGIPRSPVVRRNFPFTRWELSPETADLGQTSAAQKQALPPSTSSPCSSRSPHQQMPKANSSLARILEAYQDTPGGAWWSPLSPNPGKKARPQGSWGHLECGLGTAGHGRSWKEKDENHTFRSTSWRHPVKNKEPLPECGRTKEMPPLPLQPHSLAKGRAWPRTGADQPSSPQWPGIPPWQPTQELSPEGVLHASVLEPPSTLLCNRAAARASPHHIRKSSASGIGAQTHYRLIHGSPRTGSWDGKASSNGPLMDAHSRAYLNWNGAQACQLVPGEGLRCRVEALPLPLCYPPSDCLEWSDLPLPAVLPKNDWGSNSPEPWHYPRMKLY